MIGSRRSQPGGHLSFRSANPALSAKTFAGMEGSTGKVMTVDGTVDRVAMSLAILLACGYLTYSMQITGLIFVGVIGGLIVALVTIFKKHLSPITVPIYAALEGVALGGISFIFNEIYDCLLYTSPSPRDRGCSRMPSSA